MTRGILIAGNESSLFSAVAAEAVKRVESFSTAVIPNRFPLSEGGAVLPSKTETPAGAIPLSWNPASPISARTLVLAAENRLEHINNAIITCSPPAVFKTIEAITLEEMEILVNDHIRGWFFLIRELILYFRRCGAGSLSLVAPEITPSGSKGAADLMSGNRKSVDQRSIDKNSPADLVGPSASALFRTFAQSVLASTAGELFQVMGFTTTEAGDEGDFAAWIFKIIDEGTEKNSGRWHRYSKLKFFR